MLPVIFGLSGTTLSIEERAFFRVAEPVGYILFARNVVSPQQLHDLTAALRDLHGREDLLILVDQEGGRVARLAPPAWPAYPAAAVLAAGWQRDREAAIAATQYNYEALGIDLALAGINVDCAPVLDLPRPGAHDVIGDRAFGADAAVVATLGQAVLDGLAAAGVAGVIKHIPGHGRAVVDSHHALPVVTASEDELWADAAPFAALAHAPIAMTAHVQYDAWDPNECATLSGIVIQRIIRERIGFDGLLLTDDLDMRALSGTVATLAVRSLAAGCDVALNCWGDMAVMQALADVLPEASDECRRRVATVAQQYQKRGHDQALIERQHYCIEARDRLLAGY